LYLPPQPARLLALLISRRGLLVTREEVRRHIWPDTIVEFDHGLNTCIRAIRLALGEKAEAPEFVQTVPRRGYRFIAEVRPLESAGAASGMPADLPRDDVRVFRMNVLRNAWLVGAIMLTAAAGAAVVAWRLNRVAPRLAVLGFESRFADSVPDFALRSLAEEIVLSLAGSSPRELVVIAPGSAASVRDRSPADAAAALHASHVVSGTMRYDAGTLVISASLSRTADQSVLWAERYRADSTHFASEMEDIAAAIAASLAQRLGGARSRPASTVKPATRAALLRARYLLAERRAQDAIAHVESEVPDHMRVGAANALLARARIAIGDTAGARAALDLALQLDPALADAHFARAELATRSWWNWDLALREYREAIRLEPGRAEFHHSLAYLLSIRGEHRQALREIAVALAQDPVSPLVNGDVAWLHYFARDYRGAIRQARVTLALEPHFTPAMHCLMLALQGVGESAEAQQIAAELARDLEAPPAIVDGIRSGPLDQAMNAFWHAHLESVKLERGVAAASYMLAYTHAQLGDADSAFVYLDRAFAERSALLPALGVDPRFDPLRTDSRLAPYIGRLGLNHPRRKA
jgi:TolB-like protein/Tfp pilus assembly protein PilF